MVPSSPQKDFFLLSLLSIRAPQAINQSCVGKRRILKNAAWRDSPLVPNSFVRRGEHCAVVVAVSSRDSRKIELSETFDAFALGVWLPQLVVEDFSSP